MNEQFSKLIDKATEVFKDNSLTELKLSIGDMAIEMKKESTTVNNTVIAQAPSLQTAATASAPVTAITDAAVVNTDNSACVDAIKAPLLGVFYTSPSPEQPPFVKAGDRVNKGDVICIIEAMKMMNEITADCDCTIKEVCVDNGKIVEYGQMLFKIEK